MQFLQCAFYRLLNSMPSDDNMAFQREFADNDLIVMISKGGFIKIWHIEDMQFSKNDFKYSYFCIEARHTNVLKGQLIILLIYVFSKKKQK